MTTPTQPRETISYDAATQLLHQCRDGEITKAELMNLFIGYRFEEGVPGPSPVGDGYISGSWDAVRRGRRAGILTDEEWGLLFDLHMGDANDHAGPTEGASDDAIPGPADPVLLSLCDCPSEKGRFGAHAKTCPAVMELSSQTLRYLRSQAVEHIEGRRSFEQHVRQATTPVSSVELSPLEVLRLLEGHRTAAEVRLLTRTLDKRNARIAELERQVAQHWIAEKVARQTKVPRAKTLRENPDSWLFRVWDRLRGVS